MCQIINSINQVLVCNLTYKFDLMKKKFTHKMNTFIKLNALNIWKLLFLSTLEIRKVLTLAVYQWSILPCFQKVFLSMMINLCYMKCNPLIHEFINLPNFQFMSTNNISFENSQKSMCLYDYTWQADFT